MCVTLAPPPPPSSAARLSVLLLALLASSSYYCASAEPLVWEDCGASDVGLSVLAYAHDPDPLVAGESSVRSRSFHYCSGDDADAPLVTLREEVEIQESFLDPTDPAFPGWDSIPPYFNNSFDVGAAQDLVPIAPDSNFSYSDEHSPSSNPNTTWYRSVEHYYGTAGNSSGEEEYIGCVVVEYQQVAKAAPTYVAAVAQVAGVGAADASPEDAIAAGLAQYAAVAAAAAKDAGAQVVVFPEWGLMGEGAWGVSSREAVAPFCEDVSGGNGVTMEGLAALARNLSVVVVANVCDKVVCAADDVESCPFGDGVQLFNTEVALDEAGQLLAKYHKTHVWKRGVFDVPQEVEVVTFAASFGVTFGLFVCFDIAFPRPQRDLLGLGVLHFPYSVALSPLLEREKREEEDEEEETLKQLLLGSSGSGQQRNSNDTTTATTTLPTAVFEAWSRWHANATLLAADLGSEGSGVFAGGDQIATASSVPVPGFPGASFLAAEVPV